MTTERDNQTRSSDLAQSQMSTERETYVAGYVEDLAAGIDYSTWALVDRILNAFRIYPATHKLNIPASEAASLAQTDVQSSQTEIAELSVKAKGWVNAALNEMTALSTESRRDMWFDTAATTRTRIVNTLNFVIQHIDNFNYIFPSSECSKGCNGKSGGGTLAFVCQYRRNHRDFIESQGPVCTAQTRCGDCCAKDSSGHRNIYLCQRWFNYRSNTVKVGTIVHEAVHHTGPRDWSYSQSAMKKLEISKQLDNAANYQVFVRDVAWDAISTRRRRSCANCTTTSTTTCANCTTTPTTSPMPTTAPPPVSCPSSGRVCARVSTNCACAAPLERQLWSCGGSCRCYVCRGPLQCPSERGRCTKRSCACTAPLEKKQLNCGRGCKCDGCRN